MIRSYVLDQSRIKDLCTNRPPGPQARGLPAHPGRKKEYGGLHVLVNNAGIAGVNKPTDEITREEWEALFDVNVTGVFLCTKHAIGYMREAGSGSIINLSSIWPRTNRNSSRAPS
ncbi:MAG: SDR family NAD(P)-dependent oxidoreductase [Haliea sp.]